MKKRPNKNAILNEEQWGKLGERVYKKKWNEMDIEEKLENLRERIEAIESINTPLVED